MTHPTIQSLIQAQRDFIRSHLLSPDTVSQEVTGFMAWFKQQPVTQWTTEAQLTNIVKQFLLATPITQHLVDQIIAHVQQDLDHPINATTTFKDVIAPPALEQLLKYVATRTEIREQIIQGVVRHETFSEMLSQVIGHAIQDYMENNAVAKKVPGVSQFMKIGKSVLERATDTNLDQALQQHLQRNLHKILILTEKMVVQHLNDDNFYRLQLTAWNSIKDQPLSTIRQFIKPNDVTEIAPPLQQLWEHTRSTPYAQQLVEQGVALWFKEHQNQTMATVLADIHVDDQWITTLIHDLFIPGMKIIVENGYLMSRVDHYIESFYQQPHVQALFQN